MLACDSACRTFPEDGLATAGSATIEDAGRWLAAIEVGGSSDIAGALLAATKRIGSDRAGQIVYLGDGAASAGELTAETIAARVRPEIVARKIDAGLSSGTYRTLIVGGDPGTACDVTVRTFGATRKFSVPRGGTRTVVATLVSIPEQSFGRGFGWR